MCNKWHYVVTRSPDVISYREVLDTLAQRQRGSTSLKKKVSRVQLWPCQLLPMNFIWLLLSNTLRSQRQP